MGRYLREADQADAMRVFYSPEEPAPSALTIWTGDFMGLAKHNIPCPTCYDAHASLLRDVTPGQYRQVIGPCEICQTKGFVVARAPWWVRLFWRPHA